MDRDKGQWGHGVVVEDKHLLGAILCTCVLWRVAF